MTEETLGIVRDLLPKAKAGEVQWVLGENDDEFVVNLPEFSVSVRNPKAGYLQFSIRDGNGYALVDEGVDRNEEYTHFEVLWGLFQEARRKALNIPAKLQTLKDQLKKPGIIGSTG